MQADDGFSDVVDWDDDDPEQHSQLGPPETAESTGEQEADAVSLAGEEDDDKELLKYHSQTWDTPAAPESVEQAAELDTPKHTVQPGSQPEKISRQKEPQITPLLSHASLPPKPQTGISIQVMASAISMSATAMAIEPREIRSSVNQRSLDEREPRRGRLPANWEERRSARTGEIYYYNKVTDITTWDFPITTTSPPPRSRADSQERERDPKLASSKHTREPIPRIRSLSPRDNRTHRRSLSPELRFRDRRRSRSVEKDAPRRRNKASPPSTRESAYIPRDNYRPSSRDRARSPHQPTRNRSPEQRAHSPGRQRDDRRRERRHEPASSSSNSTLLFTSYSAAFPSLHRLYLLGCWSQRLYTALLGTSSYCSLITA